MTGGKFGINSAHARIARAMLGVDDKSLLVLLNSHLDKTQFFVALTRTSVQEYFYLWVVMADFNSVQGNEGREVIVTLVLGPVKIP